MSRREAFERFAERVLAPAPPLPPVHETDAAAAFDAWMARAPRLNRLALRAALRVPALPRPAFEALRAAAAISYYGDPRVARLLGYDPR